MVDLNQVLSIIIATITAIGTTALAYSAGRSFEGLENQIDLLNRQSAAMEKQSRIMLENMEHDRLTRKYERLNRTMIELVGPLLSKKDSYLVFESAGNYGSENVDI